MLRPRLPLPVVVGDQPVTLRIARLASDDRHPPLALFQCAQDPLTQGFLLPLALPLLLLLLPCSWRVSLVAAIALLAPPLSRLAAGGVWAALYQQFVASKADSCVYTFADRFLLRTGLDEKLPWLFEATASCAEANVPLLGVSFAYWSAGLFAVLLLLTAGALRGGSKEAIA